MPCIELTSAKHGMSILSPITASTTLEFDGELSTQESNIYGLVTLKAPPINYSSESRLSTISRVPIDLFCIVDQSRSMAGRKMILLKQTLICIIEQLNEWDRLAIISFDKRAYKSEVEHSLDPV
jgi:Mg-chelatase subunit ChlD